MKLEFRNFTKFICFAFCAVVLLLCFVILLDYFFYYSYKGTNKNVKSLKDYISKYTDKTRNEIDNIYMIMMEKENSGRFKILIQNLSRF